MKMRLTVLSPDVEEQRAWFRSLEFLKQLGEGFELTDRPGKVDEPEVFFVSPEYQGLDQHLLQNGRKNKCVILVLPENRAEVSKVTNWFKNPWVDDVAITPFRPAEVISRVREAERLFLWQEVQTMNSQLDGLVKKLRADLAVADQIQKARYPVKFDDLKGLTIRSRYLAGVRAGGDYFDVVESKSQSQVSFLLTDSSSYGLSSSLLGVLMRVAIKMVSDENSSALDLVKRIYSEIELTLTDKDRLSLFFGVFSRKDYSFRYISLGEVRGFLAKAGQDFIPLANQGSAIVKYAGISSVQEGRLDLGFEDRLALVSDGFLELGGGEAGVMNLLNSKRSQDVLESLNELVYRVKTGTGSYDELPLQDCTGLLIEFNRQLVKVRE